ncbi:amino acid adenylation domain-containing protein [Ketobacter sp.]|uniref:amino acid adenylation domain-containing protein n=1 Tax=Ketobacter sp. TaxID=2083498 RepID=UPI000F239F8E|nr:amino acid adenylation domain-containing protein [Ketobacter sp.]RLT95070.1 MAG: D-alanine--poly(phosphoribitol) ligase [Ketobacter sp.]
MNPYSISFGRAATATPNAPALVVQGNTYTYAQLHARVNGLRAALRRCAPSASVAIYASRSLTAYVAVLACAAESRTWVPLNPSFPAARNLRMLTLSGARILIVDEEAQYLQQEQHQQQQAAALRQHPALEQVFGLQDSITSELVTGAVHDPAPANDHAAYLLFTSGTTGQPKGIPVAAACLVAYLQNFSALYPLPSGLRCSQMFDLTFDLSVHDMFVCWYHGGCLVVPTATDLLMPLQFVRRQAIDVWFSVPSMASLAKQSGLLRPGVLPSLQYAFFCGEALPVSTVHAWMAAAPNARVVNLYGPTEATIAITAFEMNPQDPRWQTLSVAPIGTPYPGQFAKVVDAEGNEAPEGEQGELWLAGSQLTQGYLADAERTTAAFVNHVFPHCPASRWYRTGDCALQQGELGLVYVGRLDRQVKINGYRVELQDVEHHLRQAAATELVAVLPYPQRSDGLYSSIVGFVVQPALATQTICDRLSEHLPAYMQIVRIHTLESLPLNANGKVDYAQLQNWLNAKGDHAST